MDTKHSTLSGITETIASLGKYLHSIEVFLFAFGNFLFYIPLTVLTKMSATGVFHGIHAGGFEILPLYAVGNCMANFAFFFFSGWLKDLKTFKVFGIRFPSCHYISIHLL